MSGPRWRTVHDRFHVLGYNLEGLGELLETCESRIEAEVLGGCCLDGYGLVEVFDSMARRGAWQLWRVTAEGIEEVERRPLA